MIHYLVQGYISDTISQGVSKVKSIGLINSKSILYNKNFNIHRIKFAGLYASQTKETQPVEFAIFKNFCPNVISDSIFGAAVENPGFVESALIWGCNFNKENGKLDYIIQQNDEVAGFVFQQIRAGDSLNLALKVTNQTDPNIDETYNFYYKIMLDCTL